MIVYFPEQSFYFSLFREQVGFIWSLSFSCGWLMHMYFYAYTLVLISNFPLIQSFSLCSSLNVPANDFVFSPVLIQTCKFWHSFTCWKDETSVRLEISKFRKNLTKSGFKINHVAKLPNQNRYKSQRQIAHEQRREKNYLFQWLHSWTHTIYTFESKERNASHPRKNLLWIIDKETYLQQRVSNRKILAWGSMFQVQILYGTKTSEWTLNVKCKKNPCHTFSCFMVFGEDMGIKFLLSLICLVIFFWNVDGFGKLMSFLCRGECLGKSDQYCTSSARRMTKILYIALNT